MSTLALGVIITMVVVLIVVLVFRFGGEPRNATHTGAHFSSYDGGHDGLGQHGTDAGSRHGSHDASDAGGGSYP